VFILNQKLKHLKLALKTWNKNSFGDVHAHVKNAIQKVGLIQEELDISGATYDLLEQEKSAQIELEKTLDIEETFWQQKSKVQWHTQGDRNTSYSHRITKIRNASNLISSITNGDAILTDRTDISEHFVNHYTNLFNHSSNTIDNGMVEDVIPSLITDRINNILTMFPSQ